MTTRRRTEGRSQAKRGEGEWLELEGSNLLCQCIPVWPTCHYNWCSHLPHRWTSHGHTEQTYILILHSLLLFPSTSGSCLYCIRLCLCMSLVSL